MRRKIIAVCLSAAVLLSALTPGGTADAAAKPKEQNHQNYKKGEIQDFLPIQKQKNCKGFFQRKSNRTEKRTYKSYRLLQKGQSSQKETGHCFRNSHIQNDPDPGSSSDRIHSAAGTYTKYDQPASAITDTRRSDT